MARAYAGIAAPLIVMVVMLFLGATTPGYDPIRQTISELGTGWTGTRIIWLYGVLVLTCVWEPIWNRLTQNLPTIALVAALVMIGLGCFGLGAAAPESWPWSSMTWQGRLHLIFAFGFVFAWIPVACLAAARALPVTWRGLRIYSVATGLGCLVLLVSSLVALRASPPNAFVESHLGLIERVYVFAFMIWQCIVSASLARPARERA